MYECPDVCSFIYPILILEIIVLSNFSYYMYLFNNHLRSNPTCDCGPSIEDAEQLYNFVTIYFT